MKELKMKRVVSRYIRMMDEIDCPDSNDSIIPVSLGDWNLRDMVAEADYILSLYYQPGSVCFGGRSSIYPDDRRHWRNDTTRLNRFVKDFEPYVGDMVCADSHCSRFCNK